MKRVLNVVVLTLAVNFVLATAGVGWLAASGRLTKARVADVRKVLFPPPATQPTPATRPAVADGPADASADPVTRLGAMLAKAAGRPPGERLADVQQSQDVELAEVDRRQRDLQDLRAQAELAQAQAARDRDAVARDRQALKAQQDQLAAGHVDKGFDDSLALYRTLPPKQVKAIFVTLPDETVQRYLQAMDARQAAKVMKEYKSPADVDRLQRVLERIRQPTQAAGAPPAATATTATGPDGR